MKAKTADGQTALGRMTSVFVYFFDQVMPDPYVFAVIRTFLAAGLAYCFAPSARPQQIAAAWYGGVPHFSRFEKWETMTSAYPCD